MNIKSKLPNVETTIFTVMSKLANENGAVNLSQGFPNFPVDEKLISLVNHHSKSGKNQYAPMPGVPEFRNAISDKIKGLYKAEYDPNSEITVTAGATQAIFTAISAFIRPKDEVIVFSPAYDCYEPAVELYGGITKQISLTYPDFYIPWDKVADTINDRTKMIIINSPHNPSGSVISEDDLKELNRLTENTDIIILSDEVYEHIIFDDIKHQSIALHEKLRKRTLIVSSFGKTFHVTGWKMGYIVGPEMLMSEFKKVHQYNVFSCHAPSQYALADYISDQENYIHLPKFYQAKREFFLNLIKESRFEFTPSKGTYFQLLNYSSFSSDYDVTIAKKWTIENKIASIPISVFYPDKLDQKTLRFCFAKTEETLEEAAKIICKL